MRAQPRPVGAGKVVADELLRPAGPASFAAAYDDKESGVYDGDIERPGGMVMPVRVGTTTTQAGTSRGRIAHARDGAGTRRGVSEGFMTRDRERR